MKITKTAQQVNTFRAQRKFANIGCETCPCCHESMSFMEAVKKGIPHRGISSITVSCPIKTSWFSSEYKSVDKYRCLRCGAEWESEPY